MTKAILLMFDSLNRHMLPPYGCDWIHAPNFKRLAEKSVTFDNSWVGSMPCMPARRDLQTGRYNFLHRSWGPLEPFDDSFVAQLKKKDVYTHLVSDHYHYWEAGGATYHTQYNSWEFSRGQEGDPWKGEVKPPDIPDHVGEFEGFRSKLFKQDWVNRKYMADEEQHSQSRTFEQGVEFIRTNHDADQWLLHIEAFDPHEPFFSHQKYKDLYPHEYKGRHFDWPNYNKVKESPEEVQHAINEYAALLSMCDASLGKLLDTMDELDLWQDTMLIVATDHGFLLGEHEWWAKGRMPWYNELAHTPLFIWDPRSGRQNVRTDSLAQFTDLAPTLLEYFGVDIPESVTGVSLRETLETGKATRDAVLFGIHGGHVNVTDGKYVYLRAPVNADNSPLYNYTLMPTHMNHLFTVDELQNVELAEPFDFTKGIRTLKVDALTYIKGRSIGVEPYILAHQFGTLLFDIEADPQQEQPIQEPEIERQMVAKLVRLMRQHDAPAEQYERLGLK
jgi:arylsulfatase A-like enzyme